MKSFLLVFFGICFVQVCTSASFNHQIGEDASKKFNLTENLSHQNEWKADSNVNQQAVDNLVKILKHFNENGTAPEIMGGLVDLMNIVLNKDVAEDEKVKLQIATVIDSSEEKVKEGSKELITEEIIVLLAGVSLPIEDSSELEKLLSGKMNDSQKARALKVFNGFQTDKPNEIADVLIDLMKDAIIATLGDKYTFEDGKVVLKAVDGNQE